MRGVTARCARCQAAGEDKWQLFHVGDGPHSPRGRGSGSSLPGVKYLKTEPEVDYGMAITYTNRKGETYTLFRSKTKSGKYRYYFAKTSTKGEPCENIPEGFEIRESPNGIVSLAKKRST